MSVAGSRAEELRGWKQIADYLRVSIRTAQNMEKDQRLPVRRGAGIKGQVFALTNEVEEWRLNEAPSPASILQEPELPRAADKSRRQWLSAVGGSTLLAAGAGLGYLLSGFVGRGRGVPAEFRVEGSRLIISSKDGGELWSCLLYTSSAPCRIPCAFFAAGPVLAANAAGLRLSLIHI